MPYLSIHPENPEGRKIRQVIQALKKGAVMVYPTDTVYAFGCAIDQQGAIAQICKLRGVDPRKARFSIICQDISQAASYTSQMDNEIFRLIKSNVPGPYTFILKAGNNLPKTLKNKRKTIGIRIPDHPVSSALLNALEMPILTASFHSDDEIRDYFSDPFEIKQNFEKRVDYILDCGQGGLIPSTVIDCTGRTPEVIRQGLGEI